MATEKTPSWLRASEIVFGLISIVAGLLVVSFPGVAIATLILLLAIGLVFLGAREIMFGVAAKSIPGWLRGVDIVSGVLALGLSLVVIAFPGVAALTLVLLLYLALFFRGLGLIGLGAGRSWLVAQHRGLSMAMGVLSIILAIIFLALPGLAIATLILLLAVGMTLTGIEVIWAGVTGRRLLSVILGSITRPPSPMKT